MADWEVGMHSGCAKLCMARPNFLYYGLYKAGILPDSALTIGVENDAIEEENALSHLAGIVS